MIELEHIKKTFKTDPGTVTGQYRCGQITSLGNEIIDNGRRFTSISPNHCERERL